MKRAGDAIAISAALLPALLAIGPASAQKHGGTLQISHFDSPASMSILEEATGAANRPMMGVFNNLVMYKQDVAQASLHSIVPDLATGWSWKMIGSWITNCEFLSKSNARSPRSNC